MRRAKQELAPNVAARLALNALLEAAMYSGKGMGTAGRGVRRRTAVVGIESARRAGSAVHVLRAGLPPEQRNAGMLLVAAAAGGTVGAAAAWGIRHAVDLRRTSTADDGSAPVDSSTPVDGSTPIVRPMPVVS